MAVTSALLLATSLHAAAVGPQRAASAAPAEREIFDERLFAGKAAIVSDLGSEVSLLQVSQTMHRGHRRLPTGVPWVMSPNMAILCNESLVSSAEGIMALDNACKQCVNQHDEEVYMFYITSVVERPMAVGNKCADGPFDRCRDCTVLSWMVDNFIPRKSACCDRADASADCTSLMASELTKFTELKATVCGTPTA